MKNLYEYTNICTREKIKLKFDIFSHAESEETRFFLKGCLHLCNLKFLLLIDGKAQSPYKGHGLWMTLVELKTIPQSSTSAKRRQKIFTNVCQNSIWMKWKAVGKIFVLTEAYAANQTKDNRLQRLRKVCKSLLLACYNPCSLIFLTKRKCHEKQTKWLAGRLGWPWLWPSFFFLYALHIFI